MVINLCLFGNRVRLPRQKKWKGTTGREEYWKPCMSINSSTPPTWTVVLQSILPGYHCLTNPHALETLFQTHSSPDPPLKLLMSKVGSCRGRSTEKKQLVCPVLLATGGLAKNVLQHSRYSTVRKFLQR